MQNLIEFMNTTSTISVKDVIVNIILAAAMSQVVYMVFIRYGSTFSNRKQFGKIFLMVTVCTTLIISVIQASLALSLGLVGALSIVRFRTAIKEPEELAYTFLCIALGLGFGANARGLSIVCGLLIIGIVILRSLFTKTTIQNDTYNFSVISSVMSMQDVTEIINTYASKAILKRADNEGTLNNLQFIVEFESALELEETISKFKEKDENVISSFISNSTFL